MQIRTLLGYLIGRRGAILEIASDRRSLLLGFLFVLSAGLAREYDGADLLHEPWRLLMPVAASLATSFALFVLTFGVAKAKKMAAPPVLDCYRMFLSLFWMTAPLAWLYAIPYERFLGPVEATGANLWTLALVSVWRLALMIRVVSVLMGYHFFAAFFLVMALADGEALLAFAMSPIPPIEVMGGIHGSASEMLRKVTAQNLCFLGTCSFPIWLIGACVASVKSHPSWRGSQEEDYQSHRCSWPLTALVCISVGIWIAVLPFTQPEQLLAHRVEQALRQGRISEALGEMSAHSPRDFPPLWDPLPRPALGQTLPPLLDVMNAIADDRPARWVRLIYVEKCIYYIYNPYEVKDTPYVKALRQLPEGREFLERLKGRRLESISLEELEKEIKDLQRGDEIPTNKQAGEK